MKKLWLDNISWNRRRTHLVTKLDNMFLKNNEFNGSYRLDRCKLKSKWILKSKNAIEILQSDDFIFTLTLKVSESKLSFSKTFFFKKICEDPNEPLMNLNFHSCSSFSI